MIYIGVLDKNADQPTEEIFEADAITEENSQPYAEILGPYDTIAEAELYIRHQSEKENV